MADDAEQLSCATFTHGGYAKTRGHVIVECTRCGVVGSISEGEKKGERATQLGRDHERQDA